MKKIWDYSFRDLCLLLWTSLTFLYLLARQAVPLLLSSLSLPWAGSQVLEYSSSDNCLIKHETVVLVN